MWLRKGKRERHEARTLREVKGIGAYGCSENIRKFVLGKFDLAISTQSEVTPDGGSLDKY